MQTALAGRTTGLSSSARPSTSSRKTCAPVRAVIEQQRPAVENGQQTKVCVLVYPMHGTAMSWLTMSFPLTDVHHMPSLCRVASSCHQAPLQGHPLSCHRCAGCWQLGMQRCVCGSYQHNEILSQLLDEPNNITCFSANRLSPASAHAKPKA